MLSYLAVRHTYNHLPGKEYTHACMLRSGIFSHPPRTEQTVTGEGRTDQRRTQKSMCISRCGRTMMFEIISVRKDDASQNGLIRLSHPSCRRCGSRRRRIAAANAAPELQDVARVPQVVTIRLRVKYFSELCDDNVLGCQGQNRAHGALRFVGP